MKKQILILALLFGVVFAYGNSPTEKTDLKKTDPCLYYSQKIAELNTLQAIITSKVASADQKHIKVTPELLNLMAYEKSLVDEIVNSEKINPVPMILKFCWQCRCAKCGATVYYMCSFNHHGCPEFCPYCGWSAMNLWIGYCYYCEGS